MIFLYTNRYSMVKSCPKKRMFTDVKLSCNCNIRQEKSVLPLKPESSKPVHEGRIMTMKRFLAILLVLAMLLPAGAMAATRTLKLGQTGDDVKAVQTLLKGYGY